MTEIEGKLEELLGKENLENEINRKITEFNGLLTREVAVRIIAKEKNLLKFTENEVSIAEIKPGMRNISIKGDINAIYQEMRYISGKISRSIVIKDSTGQIFLKFWENDVKRILGLGISDFVKVKGANEKNGELNFGYGCNIEVLEKAQTDSLDNLEENKTGKLRGLVGSVSGRQKYFNKEIFVFFLSDGKGENEKECVMWEDINRGKMVEKGDEVILENVLFRNKKINITSRSRILLKKSKTLRGRISEIDFRNEMLYLNIEGKEIFLERQKALELLGLTVKEDIRFETIVKLKKDYLINTFITIPNVDYSEPRK